MGSSEKRERKLVDLRSYLQQTSHAVLCVGPMSRNCVDAVVGFANKIKAPIPLIASRRQIECAEFGGGYVNQWTTETFADYVIARDRGGYVPLCRDHGGPWQGMGEENLGMVAAMGRAKQSLLEDIARGFNVVHLDPSIPGVPLTDSSVVELLLDLYSFAIESARALGRDIEIEIGAEQQNGCFSDPRELVTLLKVVSQFCEKKGYKKPLFCVVQTGTLVKEMRNVGMTEGRKNESYDQKYAVDSMEKSIQYLVDISKISGVFVKEHNADYLSDGSLALRRRLEVGGVNIAPELGVCETKSLVTLGRQLDMKREVNQMLELFYRSNKWSKWLSSESTASDFEKAIIAGHYSFSSPIFQEIEAKVAARAAQQQIDLRQFLIGQIDAILQRLTWNLGYFHDIFQPSCYESITHQSSDSDRLSASVRAS